LKALLAPLDLCGTLLVAPEGINGTLAGSAVAIDALLAILATHTGLAREAVKFSTAIAKPFNRLKIRLKREIVTFNQPGINPSQQVGTYVEPKDWNALINRRDVVVLDTRNAYETRLGMFKGAVDPNISHFTALADYVQARFTPEQKKTAKIAMYCTGGIRCEKASAYMLAQGFGEVYHLQGGILKYLEQIPPEQSQWQGDCYVFDKRMAVGHGLRSGHYHMCYYCGNALKAEEQQHPHYEAGVSCHYCHDKTDAAAKASLRARHGQMLQSQPGDQYAKRP